MDLSKSRSSQNVIDVTKSPQQQASVRLNNNPGAQQNTQRLGLALKAQNAITQKRLSQNDPADVGLTRPLPTPNLGSGRSRWGNRKDLG